MKRINISPVELPEPKKEKVVYEIASALLERPPLSNGGRNLISVVPSDAYETIPGGMSFDKRAMVWSRPWKGPSPAS